MHRATFEVERPNIIATGAIAGERYATAIGAVLGLHIPSETARQGDRVTALNGHLINVAEQIE
jgi:hypothetical protein